jgi:hypothetical protein
MFKCGLEDICITAVRRLGYKDKHLLSVGNQPEDIQKTEI